MGVEFLLWRAALCEDHEPRHHPSELVGPHYRPLELYHRKTTLEADHLRHTHDPFGMACKVGYLGALPRPPDGLSLALDHLSMFQPTYSSSNALGLDHKPSH